MFDANCKWRGFRSNNAPKVAGYHILSDRYGTLINWSSFSLPRALHYCHLAVHIPSSGTANIGCSPGGMNRLSHHGNILEAYHVRRILSIVPGRGQIPPAKTALCTFSIFAARSFTRALSQIVSACCFCSHSTVAISIPHTRGDRDHANGSDCPSLSTKKNKKC